MSQVANERDGIADILQTLYAPIAPEMKEVEQVLRRELRSEFDSVDEMVRYGCLLGGKRLRPALLLLVARALGKVSRDHLVLAAVVEMIHTATLVHDDILDEADRRRHLATCNARWDNQASVLLGDYLFTHAFYLASTLESTFACRTIGRATNIVCEGELRQIHSRGNFELSEEQYLDIIDAKTAQLCACACSLGAHYAESEESVVEQLTDYGRTLGIAFQIADDLLDVLGDEEATGKSLGTDLDQQKPTLPLIRALELATPAEREQMTALFALPGERRRAALRPWLEKFDAFNYTRQRAAAFATQARQIAETLPESPARLVLYSLPDFVVSRSA